MRLARQRPAPDRLVVGCSRGPGGVGHPGGARDWKQHIAEVGHRAVPVPEDVIAILARPRERLDVLADDTPSAALRIVAALEHVTAVTATVAAYGVGTDEQSWDRIATGLGLTEKDARTRLHATHVPIEPGPAQRPKGGRSRPPPRRRTGPEAGLTLRLIRGGLALDDGVGARLGVVEERLLLGFIGGQAPAQLRGGPVDEVGTGCGVGGRHPSGRVLFGLRLVGLRGDRDEGTFGDQVVGVSLGACGGPVVCTDWRGASFPLCGIRLGGALRLWL